MSEDKSTYPRILEKHDDPVHLERPRDFDYEAEERRFRRFAHEFQREFGAECVIESGSAIQDASFLGRVLLPDEFYGREKSGYRTVLRVSNWGSLATVSEVVAVKPELLGRIHTRLDEFGYVYIPYAILDRPYTGQNSLIETWWIRYFDWL